MFAQPGGDSAVDSRACEFGVEPLNRIAALSHRFDVVHIFGLFIPRHFAALTRCVLGPTPVVASPLSHLQPLAMANSRAKKALFLRLFSPVLGRVDALHVFSSTEASSLRPWRSLRGLRTFVASLGIYPDATPEGQPGGDPSARRVVFFGRNDVHQKGIDLLIRGFGLMVRGGSLRPRPRLAIAGMPHGASEITIAKAVASEGLSSLVDVVGPLEDESKWAFLRTASALVFPSRYDGPPRPVREALSVGTPCIVSYESNMGELIERSDAGLASALDPGSIARCLRRAFLETQTLVDWKAGAERLNTQLAWPNVAQTYLDGYRNVGIG
jgi:glycosyltransferase involved in cell wall biosynthesis